MARSPRNTPDAPAPDNTAVVTVVSTVATSFDAELVAASLIAGDYAPFIAAGRKRDSVRRIVSARQNAALMSDDDDALSVARGIAAHQTAADAACATARPVAAPVDWSALVAGRIVGLRGAADALASGLVRPSDVPTDADLGNVETLALDLFDLHAVHGYPRTDDDTVSALATARVGQRVRSGVTHDVARGVAQAMSSLPTGGFMKVSAIAGAWLANGGPAKADGRISARLFAANGCTIPGVTGTEATTDSPRGATVTDADALAAFIADQSDDDDGSDSTD